MAIRRIFKTIQTWCLNAKVAFHAHHKLVAFGYHCFILPALVHKSMDSRKNESRPPPSFYTTASATTSNVDTTTQAAGTETTACAFQDPYTPSSTFSTGTGSSVTSDTSQITTVAVPSNPLQSQCQPSAITQSSAVVLSKISHNTSAISAITASAVSNTVLASAAVGTVGMDGGGEIGAGGGVAGQGGGKSIAPSALTQSMPTTTSSSMDKGDVASNIVDPNAVPTSTPKALRPAVFDKASYITY